LPVNIFLDALGRALGGERARGSLQAAQVLKLAFQFRIAAASLCRLFELSEFLFQVHGE
jgi:hypothetical protein